jgi:hypothetical protein
VIGAAVLAFMVLTVLILLRTYYWR